MSLALLAKVRHCEIGGSMSRVRLLVVCLVLSVAAAAASVGLAVAAGPSQPTSRSASRVKSKARRSSSAPRRRTHRAGRSGKSHHKSQSSRHGRHRSRRVGKRGRVAVGGAAASSLAHPLAVEGVQPLIGDEGLLNEKKAELLTPESVNQRAGSVNAYEGLSSSEALSLSNRAFPSVSGEVDGGPPSLPEGQRVVGFPTDFAMSVEGSNGGREVREGLEPVALEKTAGQRTPIELGLAESNGAFQPKSPLVPVGIPGRLGEGVTLPAAGVTVTPVDERGDALPGTGLLDGVSVFYGTSESAQAGVFDLDTIVKPSTFGLTIDQSLRSQRSPSKLFFKLGLPEGASLVQEDPGFGPVRVLVDGRPVVVIFTPSAEDAQGTKCARQHECRWRHARFDC